MKTLNSLIENHKNYSFATIECSIVKKGAEVFVSYAVWSRYDRAPLGGGKLTIDIEIDEQAAIQASISKAIMEDCESHGLRITFPR